MTKWFRLVVFNGALVVALWLVLLLLTAVAADIYNFGRYYFPRTDDRVHLPNYPDKTFARELFAGFKKTIEDYVPFVEWRRVAQKTKYVNIDEHGYRMHTEGKRNNVADPLTIGFFGGSTMWGTGVADDGTIPALFDQLTTQFEVTNYGEGGHNTRQMFALLVNLIDTGQMPDVVVFYDGYNHIWTHCNYAVTRSLNGHMVEAKMRRALTERPSGGYVFTDLVMPPMNFLRLVFGEKAFVVNDYACHDDPERAEAVAQTLVNLWEMANTLVTHYGGKFYAFLQPIGYLGTPRLDHLKFNRPLGREQFEAVYPILQRKGREKGFPWWTDISDAFDGTDEYIYIDTTHVTRNGNTIVAKRMLDRIEQDFPDAAAGLGADVREPE